MIRTFLDSLTSLLYRVPLKARFWALWGLPTVALSFFVAHAIGEKGKILESHQSLESNFRILDLATNFTADIDVLKLETELWLSPTWKTAGFERIQAAFEGVAESRKKLEDELSLSPKDSTLRAAVSGLISSTDEFLALYQTDELIGEKSLKDIGSAHRKISGQFMAINIAAESASGLSKLGPKFSNFTQLKHSERAFRAGKAIWTRTKGESIEVIAPSIGHQIYWSRTGVATFLDEGDPKLTAELSGHLEELRKMNGGEIIQKIIFSQDQISHAMWLSFASHITPIVSRSVEGYRQDILGEIDRDMMAAKWAFVQFAANCLIFALASILIAGFVLNSVAQPLRLTAKSAMQLGRGDAEVDELPFLGDDEIGFVARTFNQLNSTLNHFADELEGQQEAIRERKTDHRTDPRQFAGRWKELSRGLNSTLDRFEALNQERVEAEKALREAQKAELVSRFAGGIAHDFNNLLTVIIGYSAEIRSSDPEVVDGVAQIHQAGERARGLVTRLLSAAGSEEMRIQPVALNSAVKAVQEFANHSSTEGVRVEFPPILPGVQVDTDSNALFEVLLNLIDNAVVATKGEGTRVQISLVPASKRPDGEAGRFWVLKVQDDGCGMSEEQLKSVLDPFYTTKAREGFSGLGLTMALGLVKRSGGWLDIDSSLGEGTVVSLAFSESSVERVEQLPTAAEPAPAKHGKALLVEDNPMVLKFTSRSLQRLGFEVVEATDGLEGIDAWRANREDLDLVVSDILMPRLNGPEMVQQLLDEGEASMRILFITGFSDDQLPESFHAQAKSSLRLQKPFSVEQLSESIDQVMLKS